MLNSLDASLMLIFVFPTTSKTSCNLSVHFEHSYFSCYVDQCLEVKEEFVFWLEGKTLAMELVDQM